jgi:hypothetical protein
LSEKVRRMDLPKTASVSTPGDSTKDPKQDSVVLPPNAPKRTTKRHKNGITYVSE